ncbi:MAG: (2Fe-2S)-binding protein [Eubacteriales bacterium]|nr:(2Fe-2S)-binding protein [Eubacteriales bacterium]
MEYKINFYVNDEPISLVVKPNHTALRVLREQLDLTGSKEGCSAGECGACTIIVDNKPMNACLILAPELDGVHITTVEGLSKDGKLTPLQESFISHAALQCGYCTPGFLMSATALLNENPKPSREEIVDAISGNLCRCTGYKRIIEAIEDVVNSKEGR